jgi:hypothetical protein
MVMFRSNTLIGAFMRVSGTPATAGGGPKEVRTSASVAHAGASSPLRL